jgi:hypothetical protein
MGAIPTRPQSSQVRSRATISVEAQARSGLAQLAPPVQARPRTRDCRVAAHLPRAPARVVRDGLGGHVALVLRKWGDHKARSEDRPNPSCAACPSRPGPPSARGLMRQRNTPDRSRALGRLRRCVAPDLPELRGPSDSIRDPAGEARTERIHANAALEALPQ